MTINSNPPSRLGGRVDKAEEIFLASLDFPQGVRTSREIGLRVVAVKDVVGCAQWSVVDDFVVFLRGSNVEASYVSWRICY